jgi:hypothetical protein
MIYSLAASAVVIVHFAFVLFVLLGAFLVLRWRKLMWFHLAAVIWGALIEFVGFICPLTPLEVALRRMGGQSGYEGDFIERYITSIIYPAGLTREWQIWLGVATLLVNLLIYSYVLRRSRSSQL